LWIVEDAAQAVGARATAGMAGSFGRAGCLSFYPTKNLGGIGDGGMVLTSDEALATLVRRDRNQGMTGPYEHAALGACSRLDSINAAALWAKLPYLDGWNARRRAIAARYAEGFLEAGLAGGSDPAIVLPEPAGEAHVFHQYVVRARARDALAEHLAADGVATQVYYRTPLHRQPALAGHALVPCPLPHAERAAGEVLALPVYPELDDAQVAHVVRACARFYDIVSPARSG
jgi:dTDP-4-amino-4,6-dideoxygalactose transaminase